MIRAAIQRTAPDARPKPSKGPRTKKCATCREPFAPLQPWARACSIECALKLVDAIKQAAERKADKVRKQALKTRQDWLREAQAEFNAFIRARDAALPCISCGRHHTGQYHAGHFRSVGAQPALRFDENNVHKQCAPCNNHLAGNIVEYRIRLIEKIGALRVELLEIEYAPTKYTIEDAKRIKETYRAKLAQLKKETT